MAGGTARARAFPRAWAVEKNPRHPATDEKEPDPSTPVPHLNHQPTTTTVAYPYHRSLAAALPPWLPAESRRDARASAAAARALG